MSDIQLLRTVYSRSSGATSPSRIGDSIVEKERSQHLDALRIEMSGEEKQGPPEHVCGANGAASDFGFIESLPGNR
jgi:hypothetical protein